MSVFTGKRIDKEEFNIDVKGIREGLYTDDYFNNTVKILQELSKNDYIFKGETKLEDISDTAINTGDIIVEQQIFTRRKPFSLVAGVDECLAILEECTGYYDDDGKFINTYNELEVEAVEDGTFAYYNGDPKNVQPVIKIRGRYRDFANLETVLLGILTEGTRVATNVYNTLLATRGKNILFFPARFTYYKTQALHGYAYQLAVLSYNKKYGARSNPVVSTQAQGKLWNGVGKGTMAHATIASFLGDVKETMLQFSKIIDPTVPRVALVDFDNDCVKDTLRTMEAMFQKYWQLYKEDKEEAKKYKLFGVRPDTSGNMRDKSIEPIGEKRLDQGVNPRLVWKLRKEIDLAYKSWAIPFEAIQIAREWCQEVNIIVTGGFSIDKINWFEEENVPVDSYGVGSSLLENSKATNNDFTADTVRVRIDSEWYPLAKEGRCSCDNPALQPIHKTQELTFN